MSSKNRTCFGVSFGNTNLCIAVHKEGRFDVVANDSGDRTTPAIVNFSSREICVGLPAKNRLSRQPHATIQGVKKLLGSNDPSLFARSGKIPCEKFESTLKFSVKCDTDGDSVFERKVSTEDIFTIQLKKLHDIAQNLRKDEEFPCVISVPFHASAEFRNTVLECAKNAGFHVLRVINEPMASLLPYLSRLNTEKKTAIVLNYRLGGESSDIAVMAVTRGMTRVIKSKHVAQIGGSLWTMACAKYAMEEFRRKFKVSWEDLSGRAKEKVLSAAETSKHVLSSMESCSCSAESIHDGLDMNVQLTRARFEVASQMYLQQAKESIKEVLDSENVAVEDIDMVILSGGGCKMVSIQKLITREFSKADIPRTFATEELNAIGACMQADILLSQGVKSNEACLETKAELKTISKSISVQLKDGTEQVLIPKGSPIPLLSENPIVLTEEESSVRLQLSQEGVPIARVVMNNLNEKSNLVLSLEISENGVLNCHCTDKTTNLTEAVIVVE